MNNLRNNLGLFFGQLYDGPAQDQFWYEHTVLDIDDNAAVGHMGNSIRKTRYVSFVAVSIMLLSVLFSRFLYMQLWKGDNYAVASQGNRQRVIPIAAERGIIYDRNDIRLTENIPNFSVAIVPQDLPRDKEEREAVVSTLSGYTGQEPDDIRKILTRFGSYSFDSITILEDIPYESALQLQIAASDMPGIRILRGSKRLYAFPFVERESEEVTSGLAHSIGYLAKLSPDELESLYKKGYIPSDTIGKVGIEKSYESALRGVYGKKTIEVDVLGRQQSVLSEVAPEPGSHVQLSIDAEAQFQLESIMQKHMDAAGKSRGAAVAINPQNGEVLALISLPGYNNNDFSGGISNEQYKKYSENEHNPLFQRAISGTYPSGSTIKPAVAAAALEEGIITNRTSVISNGGIRVGDWYFPDWQAGGHGITNVRRSLAWSVNTFYYYIGGGYEEFDGLGVRKIGEYLQKFGFAQATGIDIPGERSGFIPTPEWKEEVKNERWYIGDTYNLSIGQGDLLTTPLQIASMTVAFANGGTLYEPHMVRKVIHPVTKDEEHIMPNPINKHIVSREHVQTARLGMRDCVTLGSCRRLSLLPFSSAGKTGTAQWSSTKEPHAWFTSFAPFDNPEIVVTVLVEEGGGGSSMSAPIVHEFYQWWGEHRL